jgi:hypothetical protein
MARVEIRINIIRKIRIRVRIMKWIRVRVKVPKTVFMFSIHSASIGPSKMVHLFSSPSSATYSLMILEARPSCHSKV